MWPVSCKTVITKMREYCQKQKLKDIDNNDDSDFPILPLIPTTYMQCEQGLEEWEEHVPEILSSPLAQRFTYWVKGMKTNLAQAKIQNLKFVQFHQMLEGQNKKKLCSRKSIQTGGALTASQAHQKIRIKYQKEQAEAERKANKVITLAVRAAEKVHY